MKQAERRLINLDFDILASLSARCLKGRAAGFIDVEITPQPLPAVVTFRLSHPVLGDFGTVEISKRGSGVSQVFFTGLPSDLLLPPTVWTLKDDHYQAIKDSYFFMITQEFVIIDVLTIAESTVRTVPKWLKRILDAMHTAGDERAETVRRYFMDEVDALTLADEWGKREGRKIYPYEVYKYFQRVKNEYPEFDFQDKRKGKANRVNRVN